MTTKVNSQYSIENIIFCLFFFKCFFFLTCLNSKLCFTLDSSLTSYLPTFIENNYFYKDITNNQGDVAILIGLYSEKAILLLILGGIILFTMIGVILITRTKYVL